MARANGVHVVIDQLCGLNYWFASCNNKLYKSKHGHHHVPYTDDWDFCLCMMHGIARKKNGPSLHPAVVAKLIGDDDGHRTCA